MPVPTPINLNDSVPAPPLGRSNVRWQSDASNPRNVSAYIEVGGVKLQAQSSYTITADDHGRLLVLNDPSAVAVTLPVATGFPSGFWLMVENIGAGLVTITPTTSTLDGGASLALGQNQGAVIFSDGTNYFTMRGVGGGTAASANTIGFIINDGSPGVNVGPMLRPARGGSVSKCVGVIKQSDPNISCRFIIRQNGGSVFASTPTLSAGAAEGTAIDISPLASDPLDVLTSDVFSIDIEQGSDLWQFSVQLVE